MKISKSILEGAAGTTAMTIFSQYLSDKKHKNYSEPDLLAKFVHRSFPALGDRQARLAGWALHYGIGAAMMVAFRAVAKRGGIAKPLVYGVIGGLVGVAVWQQLFRKSSAPPRTDLAGFLTQLVPAHVIFSLPLLFDRSDREQQ
ncbi:hypothetical protein MKQ70_02910 [Chitinophaga sedimenti]|uniref:hypothetical protein n=1 Tax=Chitinophaga sedimenti TaxID=2033606 RepID=UPI002005787E|nr:hypothetical protein [Chitinophaga sedimenti]MCK7554015.1 hypothetical protein [Chitinophaga sedimenti]